MMSRLGLSLLLLLAGVGCGALIAVAPDIAGAVIVLQLPSALVLLADPTPARAVGRTVALFAAAASVRPITAIWFQCEGLRECVAMATGKRTILIMALYACFGFLLTQLLPLLLRAVDERRVRLRLTELTAQRARIAEEWELYG